jgi:hypothetical protein
MQSRNFLVVFTGIAFFGGIAQLRASYIPYDVNAPSSNFSAPVNATNSTPYTITVADDGTNYNVLLTPDSPVSLDFANLYLGNPVDGAFVGFELGPTSSDAFVPGVSGTYSTASSGISIVDNASAGGSFSVSIPNTVFTQDTLDIPGLASEIYDGNGLLQVRDSQSFGYTYSGDTSPADASVRYGVAAVPEPASLSLLCLSGLALIRRRRTL